MLVSEAHFGLDAKRFGGHFFRGEVNQMLSDNTYRAEDEAAWPILGSSRDSMKARLNENDRNSVDLLLAGDGVQSDALEASVLDRVNIVRRFLSLLEVLPADEPRSDLAAATLKRIAALSAAPPSQADNNPSATL